MKRLTEQFNKACVTKGEKFQLELDANPSTGYSWDVIAPATVKVHGEHYAPLNTTPEQEMLVGQPIRHVLTFEALQTGVVDIRAEYKRPFEKKPPVQKVNFKITVV